MINFSNLHPAVSALYFVSVLVITMFTANPILLFGALLGGFLFYMKTEKCVHFLKEFCFYFVLIVIIALTNPLFSHDGVTPLFFLNGNPITLEALLYGADIALMLVAVMYWFKCFNKIMTEDKLLFLFAKISPKISLLLSSALRFIPLLKNQAARIRQSQKAMGLFTSEAWTDKLRGSMRVYSALITWALENAIDTGSSMKARGYGLKGRRHYSIFTFRKSDALLMTVILAMDVITITGMVTGQLEFSFYPTIYAAPITIYSFFAMITFMVLSLLPFILEVKEGLQWKYYRSKI